MRPAGRELGPQPFAEGEPFQIEADIDGQPLAVRPVIDGTLGDRRIVVAAVVRHGRHSTQLHCAAKCRSAISPATLNPEPIMSVDAATVRRIAHLARIAVADDEIEHLQGELNAMLAFVEQLSEVNVEGVEPMTSVTPMQMKKRTDVVTDGGDADAILKNAPATQDNYFLVPKVVE